MPQYHHQNNRLRLGHGLLWLMLLILLTACRLTGGAATSTPPAVTPAATVPATAASTPSPTLPPPSATPLPTPSPTPGPPSPTPLLEGAAPVPSRVPTALGLDPQRVFIHPGPERYAGDILTFQFVADLPADIRSNEVGVAIYVNGEQLVSDRLNWRNFANEPGGLYPWVWDTTGLPGRHEITIVLDPDGAIADGAILDGAILDGAILDGAIAGENGHVAPRQVTLEVELQPARPAPTPSWVTVQTDCCRVYAISQTAAHRDIEYLAIEVDLAFADASASLQEPSQRRFDVYFIDRVIGQGGYAATSIVISYLDRNYAGLDLPTVLHHEAVHLIDRQFAPNRIPFLAEGVAVWAAGGHYKREDLNRRAAALLAADLYIPLAELVDDFYLAQHEIGYLQAGSFVSYLVTSYGWTAVRDFYADTTPNLAPTHTEAISLTLERHFNQNLADMEADWLAFLRGQRRDPKALPDLETTIAYYETLRAYQAAYDPSAYFLTAWLPLPDEAQMRGITADFSRRPTAEINIILETMLIAAHRAMSNEDYRRAQAILSSVNRVINSNGQFLDPLGTAYRDIVRAVTAAGYSVQSVDWQGEQARATAVRPPALVLQTINLALEGQNWVIVR
jgi:hypothetical protein